MWGHWVSSMSVSFSTRYTDRTNPERPRRRPGVSRVDSSPEPSTERDEIKLTGKFTNDGTFGVQYSNDKGGIGVLVQD